MKLSNIFKKENKTAAKTNIQKLEKNQLEKVVGGADDITTSTETSTDATTKTGVMGAKAKAWMVNN